MVKKKFIVMCVFTYALIPWNLLAASHNPQQFLKSIEGTPQEGQEIVKNFCASCHAVKPMIELGAPKIHKKEDWDPRIKQGLEVLLHHTEEGLGAMPARGGCFECTDKQLELAILAMLPKSSSNQDNTPKKIIKKTNS